MRAFLYHHTKPDGKIFTDEDEYNKALREGWVEAPWLVTAAAPVQDPVIEAAVAEIVEAVSQEAPPLPPKHKGRWPEGYVPKKKVKKHGNKPNR
jgi:hypothetical protein